MENNPASSSTSNQPKSGARLLPFFIVFVIVVLALSVLAKRMGRHTDGLTTSQTADSSNTAVETTAPGGQTSGDGVTADSRNSAPQPLPPVSDIAALARLLADPSLGPDDQTKVIKALVQNGSSDALDALRQAFNNGSTSLKVAIAKGLADCTTSQCIQLAFDALASGSPEVVQAAAQSLSHQGSPEAVEALARLLQDPSRSDDVRGTAAAALGSMKQPGALQALTQAAMLTQDEALATDILNALGGHDFRETQAFFQDYLRSAASSDLRVAAVEAIGEAQGDPTAFLGTLLNDADPEVRAAAAWALSTTEATGKLASQLVGSLQAESDPDVRLRMYDALKNQEGLDVAAVLRAVQNEKDPAALVAGLDLLAKTLRDSPTPELQSFFNQTGIGQLKQFALTAEDPNERMRSVIALIRSNSPEAVDALREIGQTSTDPRVKQSATTAGTRLQGRRS